MSTHKHIDKICLVAALLALILCAVFMNGEAFGIQAASKVMGYEERLFDTSKVHTIDIIMDDWDAFLETARSEEYSVCSVVIDGEAISNVGIRGKGNTSLSNVASMDSDRYSFKIEFDQYDSTKNYHGLDKLSLNNIIQDNTYMKDYLTYQMMGQFGVAAPLCSYAYITVNGEDWGLYLAVEAVEESFLQRNYGSDYGELYKPDSMDMGGGRGNGREFDMNDFLDGQGNADAAAPNEPVANGMQNRRPDRGGMATPGGFSIDEDTLRSTFEELGLDTGALDTIDFDNVTMEDLLSILADLSEEDIRNIMQEMMGNGNMQMPDMGNRGGFGGMGSSETKLQYIDDDPDSYSAIFESAKTDITEADKNRLIASLKQLSAYENLEEVVNVDAVLRYFVVHNYVVNGDSYTGSMIHNYYLYEEDGRFSMIPWDYNLAFGTFQGGNAASSVNDDIDEVLSDRPMQAWIFSDETYSQQYYTLYAEMLEQIDIQGIIDNAYTLIAPYVEKDPTAFCTYTEFQTGVETLKEFCSLRSESVRLQLSGGTETVDAGTLDLSDMGTMNHGMGGGRGDFGNRGQTNAESTTGGTDAPMMPGDHSNGDQETMQPPNVMEKPDGMQMPNGMQAPGGMQRPGNGESAESSPNQGGNIGGEMTAGNVSPNGADGFGRFSPTGETPDFNNMGNFNGMMNNGRSSSISQASVVLLAVSVLFLTIGLIFAFKFKR